MTKKVPFGAFSFAYANNYHCKDLYLIYPKNENFIEPLKEFVYIN